jgi:dolichol-phosphate mannosyltransferase
MNNANTHNLLIFIPTYNEVDNVKTILNLLLEQNLSADILFVDDNSPDGTGDLLDQLASEHTNLKVLHRTRKDGIGSAHKFGIDWAYAQGYRSLVTMDCDLTHSPKYIPEFIAKSQDADIVVGSRYMLTDSLKTWNLKRRTMTRLGYFLTKTFLGLTQDATGAYRLYRLDRVPRQFLSLVQSNSYSFFFESLFVLNYNQHSIAEVATELPARTYGHSKMLMKDVFKSLSQLMYLYVIKLTNPEQLTILKSEGAMIISSGDLDDPQGWNEYWERGANKKSHWLYSVVASFYRKCIIGPTLNRAILKTFTGDGVLLHAGCGSGQVDRDFSSRYSIYALDISLPALLLYKRSNPNVVKLIHGSIFSIPLEDQSIDGIYNLGVMEHFTRSEIQEILTEFKRVLKPSGKVVLFWPARFSLTVIVLKIIHFILNSILRKNIILHPAEITYITSKKQAKEILESAGFNLNQYNFGISDGFTQALLIGQKQ